MIRGHCSLGVPGRRNEVSNRFSLREIHTTVEKRAHGKFAWGGHSGPLGERLINRGLNNAPRSMQVELN
jgi:hypothetical protein